jgi:hypothetical protein
VIVNKLILAGLITIGLSGPCFAEGLFVDINHANFGSYSVDPNIGKCIHDDLGYRWAYDLAITLKDGTVYKHQTVTEGGYPTCARWKSNPHRPIDSLINVVELIKTDSVTFYSPSDTSGPVACAKVFLRVYTPKQEKGYLRIEDNYYQVEYIPTACP